MSRRERINDIASRCKAQNVEVNFNILKRIYMEMYSSVENNESSLNTTIYNFLKDLKGDSAVENNDNYVRESSFKFSVPKINDSFYFSEKDERVLDFIYSESLTGKNNNIMLVGPHGCGKSESCQQYAAKRNLMFYETNCSLYREPRDFFGFKGASGGNTYMQKASLIKAFQTENAVILLDEINRAVPSVSNSLYSLLDDRRSVYFDEIGQVNVAKGVTVFSTKNIGMQYSGTMPSDRSLSDRFKITFEVTYLPEDKEVQVLMKRTKINEQDANLLVKFANTVRSKASEASSALRETISTRALIGCAEVFAAIGKDAVDYTILPVYSKDGGSNSERTQVKMIQQLVFGD
jgi:MoxR-like ATPase